MCKERLCLVSILALAVLSTVCLGQRVADSKAQEYFDRATDLAARNDPQAEQQYRFAIEARGGKYPEAWQGLERVYHSQLRFSEAAVALENYVALTPSRKHDGEVEELFKLREAANLKNLIDRSGEPPLNQLLQFIPIVAAYAGLEKAFTYAERAITLYPDSSAAFLTAARFMPPNAMDQERRRLTLIEKAISLEPSSSAAHAQLGWYYLSIRSHLEQSTAEFRKALELSGDSNADAWNGLGQCLAIQGRNQEAVNAYLNYLRMRKVPSQYDNYIKREIERLKN